MHVLFVLCCPLLIVKISPLGHSTYEESCWMVKIWRELIATEKNGCSEVAAEEDVVQAEWGCHLVR